MRDLRIFFQALGILLWACVSFAREVVDATQAHVLLKEKPQRVITLAPSLGELVADLLGGELERLIAVSEHSDYPPALKRKSSIGPYHQFNLEKVLALKPDLVLATTDGNPRDPVIHLRELGVPVITVQTGSFQEVQESMRLVGLALGVSSLGDQMAKQLEVGIQNIRKKSQKKSKQHSSLRVMLQVGDDPLVVVGSGSFLSSALEVTGAQNIYEKAQVRYPKPSLEDVIQKNPDVIVIMAVGSDLSVYERMAQKWKQLAGLKAVINRKVFVLRSDALLRPTLRLLEGISLLSRTLYGSG